MKCMWVILGWLIYHDSINHHLYPSSPVSLHRLKRWKKVSIWGVDRMKGQIWWEFVWSNGDVLFWVIWRIAFYPRWLNSRQGDIDQMSHLFLFLSYYTFPSFSFFSSEKRHSGFLDSFNWNNTDLAALLWKILLFLF